MSRALMVAALVALVAAPARAAEWKPRTYASENRLELRTTAPGEGDHWFPVWVVVLDDQVYVRLGTRAAGRIERNTTKPYVGVRVAGEQFERIKGVPAPESVERVARAMADKYWSDVIIRHMDHPLTLRLVPE
ncbi:MAG: hypothetical protein E6J79_10430 [Deltaproteobacteria bacterium]|nr:MAG: hypothetical protein E6J79_10430 [Deltaproteobacteria bacterium]